ncbi:pentatricopeptide repeat-containing protein At5g27110-like isoform X2 [Selaginella moellendorffii]|uniref:pentatricopeptide repeat-containing protein At5g27110-like isoform X2 n=1 Tax=Selaginella moellendorffii TaxID=88036 RepID=UPI000D1CA854|nr:pentatricopeptide repeat-containing protein At5g27110-like isoform X2 [Selaginella moellendorffii]|eukprot:XP_024540917.1 pentatricopeptide repeat-containing protein At5g27110-like isoform X2 [Selaginella moellendorffii]
MEQKPGCWKENALLDMYVKCGSLFDANRVFSMARTRDLVSWNIVMLAYARNGEGNSSLEMFVAMLSEGFVPDARTYVAALKACASLALEEEIHDESSRFSANIKVVSLEKGMAVHSHALKSRFLCENYVVSSLIDMYAKCGDMRGAENIFASDQICSKLNVVAWNSMIQGYVENGQYDRALELFEAMKIGSKNKECCSPDARSFVSALKACSRRATEEEFLKLDGFSLKVVSLEKGMAIHSQALQAKLNLDPFLQACLIDMYASCGLVTDARRCFDGVSQHSLVSWTALVNGYAENGQCDLALEFFSSMLFEGFRANSYTYVAALKACSGLAAREEATKTEDGARLVKLGSLEKTMAIHSHAKCSGSSWGVYLASSLIDAYTKCGCIEMARWIFDSTKLHSIFQWNSLISGYAETPGGGRLALQLFELLMAQSEASCIPDSWTFSAAVKACAALAMDEDAKVLKGGDGPEIKVRMKSLEMAMALHSRAAEKRHDCENAYFASSLVEIYARCGSMADSQRAFDRCGVRSPVLWMGLISGYCENEQGGKALELIAQMRSGGCLARSSWTFLTGLKASKNTGELRTGKALHAEVCQCGLEDDPAIATQLVDFYVKCGTMVEAEQIFCSIKETKVSTWTALIAGYSLQGTSKTVFDLFDKMLDEGFKPDSITFLSILTACSHAGLVDKGREIFSWMSSSKFGIVPSVEHYHCMADMLCRANKVGQAVEVLQAMPCKADAVTWILVMDACKKWKNVDIAQRAFIELLNFEDNAANYIILSNTLNV